MNDNESIMDDLQDALIMIGDGAREETTRTWPIQIVPETQELYFDEEKKEYVVVKNLGYIKLSSNFRERQLRRLKGAKLSVYICIALHISNKNTCFPGIETIAEETGYSAREVIRTIPELEKEGLISVKREHRTANLYHVRKYASRGKGNEPVIG